MKRVWIPWSLVLAVLSGAALAEEPLDERLQRYWTARSTNDLQTVYSLESAALPGGWLTPDQYKSTGGLPVREVKVVEAKIEGDKATVKLRGLVAVGTLGWMLQDLTQTWVLISGEWYHQTANKP